MKVVRKSGKPGSSAATSKPRPAVLCALLALVGVCGQSAADDLVPAVWKERQVSFIYGSSSTLYECHALTGRVASILRAVGARDDLKVSTGGCSSIAAAHTRVNDPMSTYASGSTDPSRASSVSRYSNRQVDRQLMHVSVRLMMPVAVTPEVRAELERDKARRELLSHVTGNPAPRFNDPIMFAAQRQPVTLSRDTIGLEAEECELLEQMSSSVFGQLGVRVLRWARSCTPVGASRIPPELVVEALLVKPFGTGNPHQAPAAGGDKANPESPAAVEDGAADPAADETIH